MNRFRSIVTFGALLLVLVAPVVVAQLLGEAPRLDPNRPTQEEIEAGLFNVNQLAEAGAIIFSTPFNRYDGYGDGPTNPGNTRPPGGRPALGNAFPENRALRVNGLDAQSCLDCHSLRTLRTIPAQFAVGGFGNMSNQVIFQPTEIDIPDFDGNGAADFNGRFINPPFSFGAGGVEMLAKEMTRDLRQIAKEMLDAGYAHSRELYAKNVYFGTLYLRSTLSTSDTLIGSGLEFDFSEVEGLVDPENLLLAPFGRKGEAISIRDFDLNAMRFHFGMEATELFPRNPDHDADGVANELLPGDFTMLTVFQGLLRRPYVEPLHGHTKAGYKSFINIGCADCHRPVLQTDSRYLPVSFPENRSLFVSGQIGDPFANAFMELDLTDAKFQPNGQGGVYVPLFSDLKRHVMGPRLAETNDQVSLEDNETFITARLWGLCDTEPYLHDGRATTIHQAIIRHGGEALDARTSYEVLGEQSQNRILEFLCSLRTPKGGSTSSTDSGGGGKTKTTSDTDTTDTSTEEEDGGVLVDIYKTETS